MIGYEGLGVSQEVDRLAGDTIRQRFQVSSDLGFLRVLENNPLW